MFPRLKIKLKRRHFDTVQAIEAESQAALNAFTGLPGCVLKMAEVLLTVRTRGRGLIRERW
jgi:hypothetical protein